MVEVLEKVAIPEVRRFEIPDLDTHAAWLLPRLQQAFPHLNDRALVGFLRGIVYNNEYLFLYQTDAVALAQVMSEHTLQPKKAVWERFVWIRDAQDKAQQAAGAFMYDRFRDWAKGLGAETIVVEEMSDVPHEMVRQHLGRVFNRQQQFARVA